MTQQTIQLDEAKFCCSLCLDLPKEPVMIPCGHSYCTACINNFWDQEEESKIFSCPHCRETFAPRPVLVKNTTVAAVVEELKKTELPADHCYAGAKDIGCDTCSGRKLKAAKFCLQCLVSYCDQHLQPHYDSFAFKSHKLVDPSNKQQENICSHHDVVMKAFCRTDQQCICHLCAADEHKGHDTVSAAAERTERQRELGESRQRVRQRIQDIENNVMMLRLEVEMIDRSADKAVRDSEEMLGQLIRLIEKRSSDVKQQIRTQRKTEVSRSVELQEKLEQEITELKKRDAELHKLSCTEDHIQFLHNSLSLQRLIESTDSASFDIRPQVFFEEVTMTVSVAKEKLQNILTEEWTRVSVAPTEADPSQSLAEPTTRAEFLRFARQISLDPNTASTHLLLCEGNRKVISIREEQPYTRHPDRFVYWPQVLSAETLTGRCYWEVERSGGGVTVAVTYKDISRTGGESLFGYNEKSWSLYCYVNSYSFRHNSVFNDLSGPLSSRVGVYLNQPAGLLSFYSISDTMTLLHRVQTTFTQPLYAGLRVDSLLSSSTAELCELK
ncbi:tripartite motif-containing protein 16-like [Genypterus blacodes]|uniref:tripartite motif-containing protein 16-like n=1 Tax=Genypterus blacodes TaxID=154954 RepID=UPI003F7705A6